MLRTLNHPGTLLLTFFFWVPASIVRVKYALSRLPRQRCAPSIVAWEADAIGRPFVGITTDGHVEASPFSARSTRVSTKPIGDATDAFRRSLTTSQRECDRFRADDPEGPPPGQPTPSPASGCLVPRIRQ